MKKISILLKSMICALVYTVTSLSIFLICYVLEFDLQNTVVLGVFCGIVMALVTVCDTLKRTVIARLMGLLSAVVAQYLLSLSGVPYGIMMYIFRNENWLEEIGHLTVNELIGYAYGLMIFWPGLLVSFCIAVVVIFIFHWIKNHRKWA